MRLFRVLGSGVEGRNPIASHKNIVGGGLYDVGEEIQRDAQPLIASGDDLI